VHVGQWTGKDMKAKMTARMVGNVPGGDFDLFQCAMSVNLLAGRRPIDFSPLPFQTR
jgi:hypothetical protein